MALSRSTCYTDAMTESGAVAEKIGPELRRWREARGWRREHLAVRLGITADWLRKVEDGIGDPSDTLRLLVAEVTGIGAPEGERAGAD
jgi:transcriptional regulator with XRE-family HTH domain